MSNLKMDGVFTVKQKKRKAWKNLQYEANKKRAGINREQNVDHIMSNRFLVKSEEEITIVHNS